MPLQRNQPSPDRQSVLSFVSPNVVDLLFYETVDAKTVGAGSATTITNTSKANQDVAVASGYHGPEYDGGGSVVGEILTLTATAHALAVDDVVVVEDLGFTGISPNGHHKVVGVPNVNTFKVFVRSIKDDATYAGVGTLTTTSTSRVYKAHPNYGAAHPDTENFSKHKLCHVKQADGEGLFFQYYYAAEREFQDNYNFEFSQADLGGNKYDTVVRTYVNLRSDFTDTDGEYQAGDAMPDVPASQFNDDYILMTRQQKRIGDAELDGLFVVEQRVYFRRTTSSIASYDEATEGVLIQTETLYFRGETYSAVAIETAILDETKWGVSAGGVRTEAKQLSGDWFLVTATDVIPQDKTGDYSNFGGLVTHTYETYITYSWPAVLGDDGSHKGVSGHSAGLVTDTGIEIMDWEDKSGGSRNYVRPMFKEQGYRGPTRATIVEEWSLVRPYIYSGLNRHLRPFMMRPLPIVYNSPYLSVQLPPTLHEQVSLQCDTSASDPTWGANSGSERIFPATNVTDWPSSFVATVEVNPFRGGYLTRQVTVYKPEPIA
jgi:hypothetical protein